MTNKLFTHVNELTDIKERIPTYLAVGNFDGVHKGHQVVLQRMVAAARKEGARTAVLTFFPHPKRVIQQTTGAYYISTLAQRVNQLAAQGIDLIITHPFNETVRQTRAAEFIEQLVQYAGLKQLWGGNFALGYKREGDVPFLRRLGITKGYTVELVDGMVEWNGELVSSSRVRRSLVNGEIEEVNGCLGRPYQLDGTITLGDQRGRTIGFPTANLAIWDELILPANGVYATYATVGQTQHMAATNVGVRPTVNGQKLTVEAHLLDFDGDLYDKPMTLSFITRIRPETKFNGLDALKAQIDADVVNIRKKLEEK
ncbi:MAG: bifunctional riboflavin kinase/FAD synthetase [Chloroflexi bacterium]|nr:bifunctional riboflavin kinase/FAD synthetase [Chloroflexota bacterium]